jgi:hypothetical protein
MLILILSLLIALGFAISGSNNNCHTLQTREKS